MPPNTNRGVAVAGGWVRLGGRSQPRQPAGTRSPPPLGFMGSHRSTGVHGTWGLRGDAGGQHPVPRIDRVQFERRGWARSAM